MAARLPGTRKFQAARAQQTAAMPMVEINMTPLVDVMLVLLILFIITAPLMMHAVPVDLPRAASAPLTAPPTILNVSIGADGRIFVGSQAVARGALEATFHAAVARDERVEMHLFADRASRYEIVAETLSAARRAGLSRIGFVTRPEAGAAP
ncbi:biopolymer transporter ExbD [Rhodocyclus tenuis]|uniref:Biopolymer transporter ExbD n=1 Tax=Rhodocyclus gracilis TaxID=2929842 RepID=A0ABX0WLQ6_9RHOO|nr:biopolymer transporter ExbD [Rhodocyclus gracilis]MRD73664.1 biopolymer transporter ExbD [Rhodocyclus gracilis]NJA89692.1 biopolymer transporter ExbD [Rhodocyclus gracilis]